MCQHQHWRSAWSAWWPWPPGGAAERQTSQVKAQRARENSAYVRKLLAQRQPEFAAALDRAEQYFSCVLPGTATGSGNDNGHPGPHVDVETGRQY